MVLMVERNRGEHLIRRFAGRGNEPDPRDVKIASLKQRSQELEFPQLFYTLAGNPVKEILHKLNLPDHRSILTDSKVTPTTLLLTVLFQEQIKMEMEYMFQDFCYSDTVRPSRSDEVLKLKNFEKDASLQLSSYQIKKGMSMSVPKSQVSQDGKDYKMAKRDYAWLMIS
ncbi:hypothetical protein Tco_1492618 [Tanacetum coccineum]